MSIHSAETSGYDWANFHQEIVDTESLLQYAQSQNIQTFDKKFQSQLNAHVQRISDKLEEIIDRTPLFSAAELEFVGKFYTELATINQNIEGLKKNFEGNKEKSQGIFKNFNFFSLFRRKKREVPITLNEISSQQLEKFKRIRNAQLEKEVNSFQCLTETDKIKESIDTILDGIHQSFEGAWSIDYTKPSKANDTTTSTLTVRKFNQSGDEIETREFFITNAGFEEKSSEVEHTQIKQVHENVQQLSRTAAKKIFSSLHHIISDLHLDSERTLQKQLAKAKSSLRVQELTNAQAAVQSDGSWKLYTVKAINDRDHISAVVTQDGKVQVESNIFENIQKLKEHYKDLILGPAEQKMVSLKHTLEFANGVQDQASAQQFLQASLSPATEIHNITAFQECMPKCSTYCIWQDVKGSFQLSYLDKEGACTTLPISIDLSNAYTVGNTVYATLDASSLQSDFGLPCNEIQSLVKQYEIFVNSFSDSMYSRAEYDKAHSQDLALCAEYLVDASAVGGSTFVRETDGSITMYRISNEKSIDVFSVSIQPESITFTPVNESRSLFFRALTFTNDPNKKPLEFSSFHDMKVHDQFPMQGISNIDLNTTKSLVDQARDAQSKVLSSANALKRFDAFQAIHSKNNAEEYLNEVRDRIGDEKSKGAYVIWEETHKNGPSTYHIGYINNLGEFESDAIDIRKTAGNLDIQFDDHTLSIQQGSSSEETEKMLIDGFRSKGIHLTYEMKTVQARFKAAKRGFEEIQRDDIENMQKPTSDVEAKEKFDRMLASFGSGNTIDGIYMLHTPVNKSGVVHGQVKKDGNSICFEIDYSRKPGEFSFRLTDEKFINIDTSDSIVTSFSSLSSLKKELGLQFNLASIQKIVNKQGKKIEIALKEKPEFHMAASTDERAGSEFAKYAALFGDKVVENAWMIRPQNSAAAQHAGIMDSFYNYLKDTSVGRLLSSYAQQTTVLLDKVGSSIGKQATDTTFAYYISVFEKDPSGKFFLKDYPLYINPTNSDKPFVFNGNTYASPQEVLGTTFPVKVGNSIHDLKEISNSWKECYGMLGSHQLENLRENEAKHILQGAQYVQNRLKSLYGSLPPLYLVERKKKDVVVQWEFSSKDEQQSREQHTKTSTYAYTIHWIDSNGEVHNEELDLYKDPGKLVAHGVSYANFDEVKEKVLKDTKAESFFSYYETFKGEQVVASKGYFDVAMDYFVSFKNFFNEKCTFSRDDIDRIVVEGKEAEARFVSAFNLYSKTPIDSKRARIIIAKIAGKQDISKNDEVALKDMYRKLVLKYHPDKNANNQEATQYFRFLKDLFDAANK